MSTSPCKGWHTDRYLDARMSSKTYAVCSYWGRQYPGCSFNESERATHSSSARLALVQESEGDEPPGSVVYVTVADDELLLKIGETLELVGLMKTRLTFAMGDAEASLARPYRLTPEELEISTVVR